MGHDAFVKNEASDPEDQYETSFSFHGFEDLFQDFAEGPFMEDPIFRWTFAQDGEDEDGAYEHYSFAEPGFRFFFTDGDENEEDHYF